LIYTVLQKKIPKEDVWQAEKRNTTCGSKDSKNGSRALRALRSGAKNKTSPILPFAIGEPSSNLLSKKK
jgi:hypothetical protein